MKIVILISFLICLSPLPSRSQDTLQVLSWNVFLRPPICPDKQMDRVDSISVWLKNSGADILVLQEVFHNRARKKLISILEKGYPHHIGPGKSGFIKTNSGVMIFSRDSISTSTIRRFKHATGSDQLAFKSGISAQIKFGNKKIQVIGTHLQAGSGEKRDKVRMSQQKTLKGMLYDNSDSSMVQILAGDFNTKKSSYYYGQMLDILNSDTKDPSSKLQHTANNPENPLFNSKGNPELIDFILLENRSRAEIRTIRISCPTANWGKKTSFLSDHNAVMAEFIID